MLNKSNEFSSIDFEKEDMRTEA